MNRDLTDNLSKSRSRTDEVESLPRASGVASALPWYSVSSGCVADRRMIADDVILAGSGSREPCVTVRDSTPLLGRDLRGHYR